MEPNLLLKQMLEFNKTAFDNSFNAMLTIQEQNAKMVDTFVEQATWMPEEGKKLIRDWVNAYKKGYKDFKKTADENYKKVDEFFASAKSE
jgi:polyhydroxyalkanoate synthesis regulator phasin